MKNDFLLEIGCEELPSAYQIPAQQELRERVTELLKTNSIPCGEIATFVSCRRLVLYIKDLALHQESKLVKIIGPAKEAGMDKEGNLTPAGTGFLRNQGLKKEDLVIEDTPRGKYLAVNKETGLGPVKEILAKELPGIVSSLHFPKKMRYGENIQFARPIRWVVTLLGKEIVNLKIGSVQSSNQTCLYRFAKPDRVKISRGSSYFKTLKKSGVVVDQQERKELIKKLLENEAKKLKLNLAKDYGLLDEVTGLVELPVVISGSFSKSYADLPGEVIAASMAKYQRIFSLVDNKDRVEPKFLAVINGKSKNKRLIGKNYETVLGARLNDAEFFFREDLKKTQHQRREELKDLILHQKLGSVYDKTERLKGLSLAIAQALNATTDICKILEKCSEICKSDLTTLMVREMTSLQGTIGREYYLREVNTAEGKAIATAIYEHYLPRFVDDMLPATPPGVILSLADKLDHVVSFIGAGILPTGSLDPYGIRRAGNGLVRIILDKGLDLNLAEIISAAKSRNTALGIIKQRAETILAERNYPLGIIRAVFASGFDNLFDAFLRIKTLTNIQSKDIFVKTAKVCERTANILKGAKDKLKAVDEGVLSDELEKKLWLAFNQNKALIQQLVQKRRYEEATKLYAESFFDLLHEFFDKVMVNVEDARVRSNRLSLCRAINTLYTEKIADLSIVKVETGED